MDSKVALVSGGTRGLGRAITAALSRAGYVVWAAYREDEAAAEETAQNVPNARVARAELSSPAEVEALVARVLEGSGRLDAVVLNAFRGGRAPRKLHEIPVEEWSEDLANNLTGPFLLTRAALPALVASGAGRLVYIGSLAMRGERGRASYVTAKNGLVGLARAAAQEYARQGVTANVVAPGFLEAGAFLRLPEHIRKAAIDRVPVGRAGKAEEIAELVAFLCSPAAAYLTGQVIGVDGGVS